MGWEQSPYDHGWKWRWINGRKDYIMRTFLTACPPVPRYVKLRLEEWDGPTRKSVWERELTILQARCLTDPKPDEIRASLSPVVSDLTDWADSLVTSYMDLLTSGLMAFQRRGGKPKVGDLKYGWRCMYIEEEVP